MHNSVRPMARDRLIWSFGMNGQPTRWIAAVAAFAVVAGSSMLWAMSRDAEAAAGDHGRLVPEEAARGYPVIQRDGGPRDFTNVYAVEQVGRLIVSGGDFERIELQDETIVDSVGFAAWHMDTKEIVCPGAFWFEDDVLSIDAGPRNNTVYVGGKFRAVSGSDGVDHDRFKLALLDLNNCSVVAEFDAGGFDGKVSGIEYEHGRLFVSGAFTEVAGHSSAVVAELNPTTGRPHVAFTTTSDHGNKMTSKAIEMNDAGDRLVVVARDVDELTMGNKTIEDSATYMFDVSDRDNPRLTDHEWPSTTATAPCTAQVSTTTPTGSRSRTTTVCCTPSCSRLRPRRSGATATATALSTQRCLMQRCTHLGHFCRTEPGPGETDDMFAHYGHTRCSQGGRTYRTQFIAYSLDDGTPLVWNPGNDAQTGGRAITVIPRGLLFGFDGWRVGDRVVGQSAFLDFGPGAEPDPPTVDCVASQIGADVELTWQPLDGVIVYQVRSDGRWRASTTATDFVVANASVDEGFVIRTRLDGIAEDWPCAVDGGPAGPSCTVTQQGGDVRLDWTGVVASSVSVRIDGSWLATVRDVDTYVATDRNADAATFSLRFRENGDTINTICVP